MALYFYLVIIAAAVVGFSLAWYILHHKHHRKRIICPLKSDCEAMVHSRRSRWLGVRLEKWGMVYYALVTLFYLLFLPRPGLAHSAFGYVIALLIIFAFLFSLYLTYLQYSHFKNWCALCLASALCSAIIFLALLGSWLTL